MIPLIHVMVAVYCLTIFALIFASRRSAILSLLTFVSISLNAIPWQIYAFGIDQAGAKLQGSITGIAVLYPIVTGQFQIQKLLSSYLLCLAGFFALLAFYLPVGGFYPYGVEKFLLFAFKCLAPVIALSLLTPFTKLELWAILGTIIFSSLLMALTSIEFSALYYDERSSLGGTLGPITIGRLLGMGIFVLALAFRQPGLWRKFLMPLIAIGIVILGYAFIGTGSRGPIIGAIVAFVIAIALDIRSRLKEKAALSLVVCIFALFAISSLQSTEIADSLGVKRLMYLFEDRMLGESELVRLHLHQSALAAFADTKGLGLGTGGFAAYVREEREWPHNIFLEVLAELGLPGFALLVLMLFTTCRRWFIEIRSGAFQGTGEYALASLWIYFFINALVSHDLSANFGFWICAAFPWLLSKQTEPEIVSASTVEIKSAGA